MRAPSTKTLLSEFRQLSPEDARLIRALASAADDGEKLKKLVEKSAPGTELYVRSMHSDPYYSRLWRNTVALHAIDKIMGTHGVEGLGPQRARDYAPAYEYLNTGDTYASTLIFDRDKDRLFVGSWGDVAEKHPEWQSSEDHATIKKASPRPRSSARLDREIRAALSSHRGGR